MVRRRGHAVGQGAIVLHGIDVLNRGLFLDGGAFEEILTGRMIRSDEFGSLIVFEYLGELDDYVDELHQLRHFLGFQINDFAVLGQLVLDIHALRDKGFREAVVPWLGAKLLLGHSNNLGEDTWPYLSVVSRNFLLSDHKIDSPESLP